MSAQGMTETKGTSQHLVDPGEVLTAVASNWLVEEGVPDEGILGKVLLHRSGEVCGSVRLGESADNVLDLEEATVNVPRSMGLW